MLSLLKTCLHFFCRPHQHPLLPRPASPLPLASFCNNRPQKADLVGTVPETSIVFFLNDLLVHQLSSSSTLCPSHLTLTPASRPWPPFLHQQVTESRPSGDSGRNMRRALPPHNLSALLLPSPSTPPDPPPCLTPAPRFFLHQQASEGRPSGDGGGRIKCFCAGRVSVFNNLPL